MRLAPSADSEALKAGYFFRAVTQALMTKASMVSLTVDLALARAALESTRNCSSSVTSDLSYCVTWGIITQLRCRFGPEIFLMRDRGCSSVGPNLLKSSDGHGSSSRPMPWPPAAGAAAFGAAVSAMMPLTKFCTSSWVMRPLGPLPPTRPRSTPSSRANLRIEGEAKALDASTCAAAGAAEAGAGAGAAAAAGAGAAAAAGAGAAAGAAAGAGAAAAPPAASSSSTSEPSPTLSPTLTLISLTTPAAEEGISMLALSDSTVIRDWSTLTVSPGLTISSMTSTSLKSPMSGTLTSTMPPAAAGAAGGAGAAAAGAAAAGAGAAAGAATASAASSNSTSEPSPTLSPTFTFNSLTTPAADEGISMLALSDSTVSRDWSTLMVSPGLTITSMTSTSLKSPISGTFTSTMLMA